MWKFYDIAIHWRDGVRGLCSLDRVPVSFFFDRVSNVFWLGTCPSISFLHSYLVFCFPCGFAKFGLIDYSMDLSSAYGIVR
jgi:hypothetical protein